MSFTQDMDDEYEKLIRRMNPPRYVLLLSPNLQSSIVCFLLMEYLTHLFTVVFSGWSLTMQVARMQQ